MRNYISRETVDGIIYLYPELSDRATSIELDSTIDHTASATSINFTVPAPFYVYRNYPSGQFT